MIGEQLFENKPIFFMMFVIVALELVRAVQDALRACASDRAARTRTRPRPSASNVIKIRYQAVILGGLIAGLGGAWFSMESQGGFQDNMTNGAGFIALAALIFGKWRPWSAFAGAMLFGFTRATRHPAADPRRGDRRLLHPERVLAVAAVRRDHRRRRGRGRPGHPAGRRRPALREVAMTTRGTGCESIDWARLRLAGT